MFRKLFYILSALIFLSCTSIPCEASQFFSEDEDIIIVIDPGHGGDNYGTTANENFQEKEITLKVANALVAELEKYDGITVYMTRTDDKDLSLTERAKYAEQVDADMLFSLHFNASETHAMFGSEVWIPLEAPYHALCYQFAHIQLQEMQDLGLHIRGIKTRKNKQGIDYYGIIRDSVARDIPAVIIEHCYVDEERDLAYCSSDEMYEELGKRDAKAIAVFWGLDDSLREFPEELKSLTINDTIPEAFEDPTGPDVCVIEVVEPDYKHGKLTIEVSAADYDTPLVYYSYSLDDGETYSKWYPWPKCDTLAGTYDDNFTLKLDIPAYTSPEVRVRAYNKFDLYKTSNKLSGFDVFYNSEEFAEDLNEEMIITEEITPALKDVEIVMPQTNSKEKEDFEFSLNTKRFLLLFVFAILWILLLLSVTKMIMSILKKHRDNK